MIEIKNKENCSWCHACYNICPVWAITMETDNKGFKYPLIDKKKCINCGMCGKVCPIINSQKWNNINNAYAMINNDEKTRLESSSWGIFSLLANAILSKWWIVFWAAFDENMDVHHIWVPNKNNLRKLMTSKYLQSSIWDSYKECKKSLKEWKTILFTWTPCQIEGLYSFLGKDYNNLYTQDLVCHWAPSPKIRQTYLKYIQKNKWVKAQKANFREKTAWRERYSLSLNDNEYQEQHWKNLYMKLFLSNYILRDSCYSCKFKKINRKSDITLADFRWIDNIDKEMNDDKWTSLVILHSIKGKELFDEIKKFCKYKKVDFNKSISFNSSYFSPVNKPKNREKFFKEINEKKFDKIVKKYTWWPIKTIRKFLGWIYCTIISIMAITYKKLRNNHESKN